MTSLSRCFVAATAATVLAGASAAVGWHLRPRETPPEVRSDQACREAFVAIQEDFHRQMAVQQTRDSMYGTNYLAGIRSSVRASWPAFEKANNARQRAGAWDQPDLPGGAGVVSDYRHELTEELFKAQMEESPILKPTRFDKVKALLDQSYEQYASNR